MALVQYPAGSAVREGYVTNATNIIKYDNLEKWVNGSTQEPVYDSELNGANKIGYLDPREKATVLYKKGSRYNVVYNTSAGVRTKSGYVDYHGNASSNPGTGGDNAWPNITPGGMVPGGFTFPNNARLVGGSLQLKDANGNNVSSTVSNGDSITVLDVGHSKQLTLVQYPVSGGVKQGYVTNNTNIIKYNDEYNWYNGTSTEAVFSKHNSTDSGFGTLAARESATKLYEYGGRVHIAYDTSKGMLTKSGYVNYKGIAIPARQKLDLGSIGHKNARLKVYGKSGNGYNLNAYKLGAADDSSRKPKKIFVGFALHGWEDHWRFDGEALVKIGSSVLNKLGDYISANGSLNGWQVCIAPCMNPDGLIAGRTSYGPGRCAVTTGIDLNRCFPTGFSKNTAPRYKTGDNYLGAPEAVALRNLINELSAEASELMVVDCHGWLGFTQGNPDVGKYFTEQFGFTHKTQYSGGFFSTWANSLTNVKGVLLEYPTTTDSFSIVENYATKTYNAIIKMIQSSNGNGGSGSGNGGGSGSGNGNIVVGSKVKITGTHWATGQAIPDWAKNTTHTVSKIDGNRALLQEVTSWIYLNDIVLADGSGSGSGSGNEDVFNRTGKIINVSSVLNVRSGPGTSYSAIGTLKGGDSVTITNRVKPSGESLYWYKIKFGLGTGYIRSDFVQLDIENLPTDDLFSFNRFTGYIEKLVQYTKEYCNSKNITITNKKINDLVLDYLRHLHYDTLLWKATLGYIDKEHVDYIQNKDYKFYVDILFYIGVHNENVQIYKSLMDIPHLAATTLGYANFTITPDFWTGWGGDLATLVYEVAKGAGDLSQEGKEKYAYGKLAVNSSFGKADFYTDIDAIELSSMLGSDTFDKILKNYYLNKAFRNRKQIIINDIRLNGSEDLYNGIYRTMTGPRGLYYVVIGGIALEKLMTQPYGDNYIPLNMDNLRAACKAFSLRINELNSEGIIPNI